MIHWAKQEKTPELLLIWIMTGNRFPEENCSQLPFLVCMKEETLNHSKSIAGWLSVSATILIRGSHLNVRVIQSQKQKSKKLVSILEARVSLVYRFCKTDSLLRSSSRGMFSLVATIANCHSKRRRPVDQRAPLLWTVYVWSHLNQDPDLLGRPHLAWPSPQQRGDACGRVRRISPPVECNAVCILYSRGNTWIYGGVCVAA